MAGESRRAGRGGHRVLQGIGAATARTLHDRGAKVGLLARSQDDLERLAARLGSRSAWATADVVDPAQVAMAIDVLADRLGPVDVLVNNAGAGAYGAVIESSTDVFEQMIRINYLGTVNVTRAVLRPWRPGVRATS